MIWSVTGLCVFKHDPVTVICLAADHSYTAQTSWEL